MGRTLKRLNVPRKDLVISTKIYKSGNGINDTMLSRKHVIEGLNASLKRLQLDYVDVVFAHRPDPITPIEEVCRAFNRVIEDGKAFYWGTSEWTPEQSVEAIMCCERLGLIKPIVEQAEYNLIIRKKFEVDFAPIYDKFGYGTTIWSPLAGGLLAGKYNNEKPTEEGRYTPGKMDEKIRDHVMETFVGVLGDQLYPRLRALGELAKELGCSQAQLSLAWAIANKDVSTCIMGASKLSQMVDNLKAIDLLKKWSKDIEQKVENVMKTEPASAFNWRDWKPFAPRRQLAVEYYA